MFAPWKKRVQCWIREKEPSSLCFVHSRCTNLALNPNLQFLLSSTAGTDQSQYLDCMRCLSPCFRDAPGWDLKIAEVFWKESLVERRWMLCRWHCFAFPDTCRHLHIIFIAMLSFQPSLHFCFFQPYHMLYQKVTPKKNQQQQPPTSMFLCVLCEFYADSFRSNLPRNRDVLVGWQDLLNEIASSSRRLRAARGGAQDAAGGATVTGRSRSPESRPRREFGRV